MIQKSNFSFNKVNNFAPVLLIAYNRPRHFKKSLVALCKNEFSEKTTLYISNRCITGGTIGRTDLLTLQKY